MYNATRAGLLSLPSSFRCPAFRLSRINILFFLGGGVGGSSVAEGSSKSCFNFSNMSPVGRLSCLNFLLNLKGGWDVP